MAGNAGGNAFEREYKDRMRFALSSLAKYSVNQGTKRVVYLKREKFNNDLDHSGKLVTKQIVSVQQSKLQC